MNAPENDAASQPATRGLLRPAGVHAVLEILWVFGRLGLTSFGGPVAHLGYFRQEFVVRRRWLEDTEFGDLVALCQFLPGPASSQVGFSIGLRRAGGLGALAAWCGFTLPSAIIMLSVALSAPRLRAPASGALDGLKLVAVAVVAQALWGMTRSLCTDRPTATIAALAAVTCLLSASAPAQWAVIMVGAIAGVVWCRDAGMNAPARSGNTPSRFVSRTRGLAALATYLMLLLLLPLTGHSPMAELFGAFYRAGALVFGGGHVVLPLLRSAFVGPGWVSDDAFLAGYGAAQAIPGPLFTFAAYLGAIASPASGPIAGAVCGLAGIFLPGLLLVTAATPFWEQLRARATARAGMRGLNAAVVGILAAALYDPIWTSTIHGAADLTIALLGFVLLTVWRMSPTRVVALGAAAGVALAALR
jgi:chromate transporter